MRKLTHDEIARKRLTLEEVSTAGRIPVAALLDNVRSLYNVGSIFRTSDGAMIEKLVLTGFTPHPPRNEIEKTALGATRSVPWEYHKDPVEALKQFKDLGWKICCLELTDESIPYYDVEPSDFPLCLVVGNEIVGVSSELMKHCDRAIEIPMFGIKQSLNVAVAYGIAVFELARIWRTSSQRLPYGQAQMSKARV
jgi:tRNA G18 (ribose-2'-O)-methylase SpoU